MDASNKNNVVSFIAHIYSFNNPLKKMFYHIINVTLIEVKLFSIRYKINQAIEI